MIQILETLSRCCRVSSVSKLKTLSAYKNMATVTAEDKSVACEENAKDQTTENKPLVVNQGKNNRLTHFLSIPLNNEIIQEKFNNFKEGVLTHCTSRKITARLFIKPATLHITIGLLILKDEEEIKKAMQCLERCKESIIKPMLKDKQLSLEVKGLDHFEDTKLSNLKVLFAKVQHPEEPELLQNLANSIKREFAKEGLIAKEENEDVTIHVTLMKVTRYSNCRTFDATQIFEMYEDFNFGEGIASKVDLSVFAPTLKDCYYSSSGSITIP